ncbi:hypothetical protein PMAYCL1PPCAC_31163, partial [Pristionchus mayeri]
RICRMDDEKRVLLFCPFFAFFIGFLLFIHSRKSKDSDKKSKSSVGTSSSSSSTKTGPDNQNSNPPQNTTSRTQSVNEPTSEQGDRTRLEELF